MSISQEPIRVLMFGTGALLRGLICDLVGEARQAGIFQGRIAAVASSGSGRDLALNAQGGRFTLCIQGQGAAGPVQAFRPNASIAACFAAADAWPEVLALAHRPEVDIIVSNSTEIGLAYVPEDIFASPPHSFPAKLCAFLSARFQAWPERPPVILPCELLEGNGALLRAAVLQHIDNQNLSADFRRWVAEETVFADTLVDRIVTGIPEPGAHRQLEAALGYPDALLSVAEPYRLWAIAGPAVLAERLPFLNRLEGAILAEDIRPWRERKLRILNGAHSFLAALGWLAGKESVIECMSDPLIRGYLERLMLAEIVPSLPEEIAGGEAFAQEVLTRFANPFLRHALLDISLQYSSKMRARNVPTIRRYYQRFGRVPQAMALGFAAFLRFALPADDEMGEWQGRRYALRDAATPQWRMYAEMRTSLTAAQWFAALLADVSLWGEDMTQLPGWAEEVGHYFQAIEHQGPEAALRLGLGSGR